MSLDYAALGLKAGLEIHQQLATRHKLYCYCPPRDRDVRESNFEFFRYLRARESELGEVDRAAAEQAMAKKRFIYKAYDTTCLVENDEEPPRPLNMEALSVALKAALMLNMKPVDEAFTMRKIVVDGSNTTGFQRTCFVASGGHVETASGRVGVDTLCLEEDAASRVEAKGDAIVYSLDRLGIPLIEIATAPDIRTPAQAREVALHIGTLLRSLPEVKRGLGTIRQDVNVSIARGARVEIKGVQTLDLVEQAVESEALRQVNLLAIRDELVARGASVDDEAFDITDVFRNTGSKVIKKAISSGGIAMAVRLRGFRGLVGREIQPGRRLGSELSDRAKRAAGVGGIFHIDELPGYGITQEEVDAVSARLGLGAGDAFVMVADSREKAERAVEAVKARAREALIGVPEETRGALPNGSTEYMRPLPGRARMYPETDVPPVEITPEFLEKLRKELPETLPEKKARLMREYGLNEELAGGIAYSTVSQEFEEIARSYGNATLVARTMLGTTVELRREGVPVESLTGEHYKQLFKCLSEGRIAKEAIPKVLAEMARGASIEEAVKKLGLGGISEGEVRAVIHEIVQSKKDFVREKGEASQSGLMGLAMSKLRGKADGKLISRILKEEVMAELKK
ncbi:glutamyl-tRNA(Gln) amidotransferase, subunit E [Methanocella conradii HZ254]|uniref:Glutamyl-tRNA(Gln) amidotransferase subunit E n=1 Tax=Methanocella conradii (strain DSM 24694 / JCM 17849 / CGMCC 1.5162 / HZ254) TaxID=1041930 RepID=H8I592_METCZ|nr:Glu-tRNA(Gln) amidotransferase subunit GatE [Methanocella conradii]AFC99289.1 glutamyl-tRNA(Gln) amidotransferase, subunit E [Methanocella conradii HZ254]